MWRRISLQLRAALGAQRSAGIFLSERGAASLQRRASQLSLAQFRSGTRLFSSESDKPISSKKVDDFMPIATGLEREEIEAELEGRKRFDMDAPVGPFGTKESPAVIQSIYNRRIVGCPGGEGEDEHDIVWFWLEKDRPHECQVCTQYFVLEVIGEGGDPDGHHEDEHEGEKHH